MISISVIIPVYNVENYLKKCVDSVLAQTFADYEILLVDDGSTDTSGRLCDEYAEAYPCISVIHQLNKGLGGARNTGMAAAQGKYLLFLDSDDYLHPETLEICHAKAERYDCDMVLFDLVGAYEDGSLGVKYTCAPVTENTPLEGEQLQPLVLVSSACNRLCKRDLFLRAQVSFPDRLWYEDLHTMPKLVPYLRSAYYYAEQPLYDYLQRSDSIMHTPDFNRTVAERLGAVTEIWEYYESRALTERYRTELEFLQLFHGFFLPVREMQAAHKSFAPYADALREALLSRVPTPLQNPYLAGMSAKERQMLRLFWGRKYRTVRLLSCLNKLLKKVKHVFAS